MLQSKFCIQIIFGVLYYRRLVASLQLPVSVCTASSTTEKCRISCQVHSIDETLFTSSIPTISKSESCHNVMEMQKNSNGDIMEFIPLSDDNGYFISVAYWAPCGIDNLLSIFYKVQVLGFAPQFYVAAFGQIESKDKDTFQRNVAIEFPVLHAQPGLKVRLESFGSNQCLPFVTNRTVTIPNFSPKPRKLVKKHFDCPTFKLGNGGILSSNHAENGFNIYALIGIGVLAVVSAVVAVLGLRVLLCKRRNRKWTEMYRSGETLGAETNNDSDGKNDPEINPESIQRSHEMDKTDPTLQGYYGHLDSNDLHMKFASLENSGELCKDL